MRGLVCRTELSCPCLILGRLDRKIEFPLPTEEARAHIMRIHSRKMNVSGDTNYDELARCTDSFNGAQLKAVCVEAGMIALRRGASELIHEDYMEGGRYDDLGLGHTVEPPIKDL